MLRRILLVHDLEENEDPPVEDFGRTYRTPEGRYLVELLEGTDYAMAKGLLDDLYAGDVLGTTRLLESLRAHGDIDRTLIVGELSLDGQVRPLRGLLAQLRSARRRGLSEALIPEQDAASASLVVPLRTAARICSCSATASAAMPLWK